MSECGGVPASGGTGMGDWPGVGGRQRQGRAACCPKSLPLWQAHRSPAPRAGHGQGHGQGFRRHRARGVSGQRGTDGQFIDRYATAGWQWQRPGDRLTPHSDPKCAIIAASHDPRQQPGKLPGDESNDEQQHGGGHGDSQQGCWPTSDLWPWLIELGHSPSGGTDRR